jgi:alkanesulfonate monooxygenase SsuD/methylene tetrahydromethanopterin reductase-like flavin-dependent oxidoreductase (luciferase family)
VPQRRPFGNGNKLKLAVFGTNVSAGCSMTSAAGTIKVNWSESVRIAELAERAGFEAIIPVARWKGFGGDIDFNHRCFETYTWAAGLGAATEKIFVFATSHVPTVHPVLAAKQAVTIDHISGGRFGLNIVSGWNAAEIEMFGTPQREHDERYRYSDEWITLIKRLWTEPGTFDFAGDYFKSPGAYSEPKPIQQPYPLIMSAGLSRAGRKFAAKHADLSFVLFPDFEIGREIVTEIKASARQQFGREIMVFGMGYVVCAESEREARDFHHYYVYEKGDWNGVKNLLSTLIPNSQSASKEQFEAMAANLIAGYAALPLVGTPDQVVDGMIRMSAAGLDGITLSWVDYEAGLIQFSERIAPLMVQAGLRTNPA